MSPTPLLSAFYFGSVEHYRLLALHEKVVIDTGEHYERQSYRTRTGIIGPNGKQDLSVQVEHDHGNKMRMCDVRLSYAETWPAQHLHAIRSAYGQTPWFIHYIDEIEATLLKGYDRLVDLHVATIDLGMRWLGLTTEVLVTDNYIENLDGLVDLRSRFHPKKALPLEVGAVPPYPQVFADRHGAIPRMSIIDLVCNCGPKALEHLRAGT
ncbi:MAG: WbqC family protein [Flavobacteriales bacterium]